MEIYGVIAVCIIVPLLVMSTFYYVLKDFKFDDLPEIPTKTKKTN